MSAYPEDAQRLTRLSEEIRARLEEIALIGSRIAGIERDSSSTPKYAPRPQSVADSPHGGVTMVEIFDATPGHPGMCVTWWADGTVGLDSPCGTEIYHSA